MAAVTDAACSNYDMTHRTETINRNAFSPQSIASPRFWSYLGGVTFLSFFAAFVLFRPVSSLHAQVHSNPVADRNASATDR